jgi:hypothetical protein
MKCTAAPFFGSDIGDGLRKVPAVAAKVLSVVLALAIGLVLGCSGLEGSWVWSSRKPLCREPLDAEWLSIVRELVG